MSRIVRRIKWIAVQCAAIALVALATDLLASAGVLPSHSVAVIRPNLTRSTSLTGLEKVTALPLAWISTARN